MKPITLAYSTELKGESNICAGVLEKVVSKRFVNFDYHFSTFLQYALKF